MVTGLLLHMAEWSQSTLLLGSGLPSSLRTTPHTLYMFAFTPSSLHTCYCERHSYNHGLHTSLQDPCLCFSEDVLRRRTAVSWDNCTSTFGRAAGCFPSAHATRHASPRDGSNFPSASSTFIISWVPCIAAALMGVSLYLAVILSCIFLTISHVEHLFMHSLAVCVSS